MPMYVALPAGGVPRPAVLVIHGIDGLAGATQDAADQFAARGYVAAAPDLFHRGPPPTTFAEMSKRRWAHTDLQTTCDLDAAIAHLQAQPFVEAGPMGIIGFCMGGRVAYHMATTNPLLALAVDCYGGNVLHGEGGDAPIDHTADIRCPVLVLDGEENHNPPPSDVRAIEAALAQHGIVHEVQLYPGVGHGFMGGTLTPQGKDAWSRVWEWFGRYLETAPNDFVETHVRRVH